MTLRTVTDIRPRDVVHEAGALLGAGYRLALVSAHEQARGLEVVYLFTAAAPDRRTELRLLLPLERPAVDSLAGLSFPAGRFEREMRDLYGITPLGHPMPRRLVRHHHWPRGWYPMRAQTGPPPAFGDPEGPFPFVTVEGPAVYEIPVGPVHAGLIEPGHFRFSVVGESIIKLKARLWFVHRGLEKLFQGRDPADGLPLAERVSGDTSLGHALAFCLAVEEATGLEVNPAAHAGRAMLLELERLYNHVTDLGALCNDVAHSILNAQAGRVREQLLRINAEVTGHRLLRGAVTIGGVRLRALPDPGRLRAIGADIAEIAALAQGHSVIADRFTGTGILPARAARDLGTLGYVARASGLDVDARRDHPTLDLGPFSPVVQTDGDVLARFQVRVREIAASIELIARLAEGTAAGVDPSSGPRGTGVGIVEGWRGTILHRIELDSGGALRRVKIVDPSFFNWPALPVALSGAIVPDFPLVNKSFNLSYAGNDL
ncbi:formate hydrogenase HycE [Acrocarpospora corrugata]|uniref:Formate hydrogenase HycE n=1 Tax=Acrocarpospora corrugata TaxID=35763 RepID=A0A5M3VRI2_9ACTN|nr:NADH-quinone oxidoreductase subunit C [Acrocarpospora corrugata]GER98798.1 formate hydrogenase HycE [Acrocarpospora corrugata]